MKTELMKGIYWVGAVDWNIRYFHGPAYSTHRGTTYNAYLIVDEKIALVDTVYTPFAGELLEHIREIIDPAKIDYMIVNHIERDHSGALPTLMEAAPNAEIYCTAKAAEGLKANYYKDWEYNIVKSGQQLPLGEYTLSFLEAPMLHWPDSMFTYVQGAELLLPNDAFGQHIATSGRYDDETDLPVLMEEAAKYYANILLPFSGLVLKKLEEVARLNIPIKMIGPSHGVIWRTNPGTIVEAYQKWAAALADPKVVIAYDTMWESTEKMAKAILEGVASTGVRAMLYKMHVSDRNDVVKEVLNARAVVVGSPTINNDFLPTLAPLLDDLKGLKPKGKLGAAFGSYGWGGGAVKGIEERLSAAGFEMINPGLTTKWVPDTEVLARCRQFGVDLGEQVKSST